MEREGNLLDIGHKTIFLLVPSSFVAAVWGVAVVFLTQLPCMCPLGGLLF